MGKVPSKSFSLTRQDIQTWSSNVVTFLAPLGVIYFGAIALVLQQPNHAFSGKDLIPSSFTDGAMVLYLANALFDLSRKFVAHTER